ncbi:hypothetical protein Hypma_003331 [Hypsizygus marmoreus]|uniref:Uncharacterized protein n=1 Tax=Hypsizygus marmoreus TaxID=39966 RepID=A0A369J2E6_HYPMA|nr:hypothetical protein Hypma_003331 [Hypsizygus marmoreus]
MHLLLSSQSNNGSQYGPLLCALDPNPPCLSPFLLSGVRRRVQVTLYVQPLSRKWRLHGSLSLICWFADLTAFTHIQHLCIDSDLTPGISSWLSLTLATMLLAL